MQKGQAWLIFEILGIDATPLTLFTLDIFAYNIETEIFSLLE